MIIEVLTEEPTLIDKAKDTYGSIKSNAQKSNTAVIITVWNIF
ncbi:hypothetical protein [Photobacterium damselae]|nr:hypothetical protein [Photobacterium damselae]